MASLRKFLDLSQDRDAQLWQSLQAMRTALPAILVVLLLSSTAYALDFDAAIGLTPNLPQFQAAQKALQKRVELDRLLPTASGNPEIALSPGVGFGPSGTGPALELMLAQSWNLGGLSRTREEAAKAERIALTADMRARQLRLKLDAAHGWLLLAEAQKLLQASQAEQALAGELQQITQKAAQRGALTAADAAEARAFTGEAELRAVFYEGEVHDRAAELARQCALPTTPLPEATGKTPVVTLPEAAVWLQLVTRAADLPDARTRQLQADAERSRAAEARSQHASTLQVGGLFQRDALGDMQALATVGIRWAAFDHGQRAAAVAAEQVVRAEGEAAQASHDGAHLLAMAWHEVEHSREREAVLRQKILPAVEDLVRLREQAFARGAATVFEVLRARRDRSEAFRRLTEAETERVWAEMKAWLLHEAMNERAESPGGGQP